MRTTISILLACLFLSGCPATSPRNVTLNPEIAIRVDARLTQPLPIFEKRETSSLTEAELLYEYTRLTNAYTMCFNDHTALIQLLLKELNRDKE